MRNQRTVVITGGNSARNKEGSRAAESWKTRKKGKKGNPRSGLCHVFSTGGWDTKIETKRPTTERRGGEKSGTMSRRESQEEGGVIRKKSPPLIVTAFIETRIAFGRIKKGRGERGEGQ